MKVTKRQIQKAIKELGFRLEDFEVGNGTIETALNDVRKGNRQVMKVVKALTSRGAEAYGFRTGYGSCVYRFEKVSQSRILAMNNVD